MTRRRHLAMQPYGKAGTCEISNASPECPAIVTLRGGICPHEIHSDREQKGSSGWSPLLPCACAAVTRVAREHAAAISESGWAPAQAYERAMLQPGLLMLFPWPCSMMGAMIWCADMEGREPPARAGRRSLAKVEASWRARLKIGLALPILAYALALAGFIENSHSILDFPLDDAWIHRVYSRSFAYGHGFAYNDGHQEAGATSPLWVIVSAPAHWLVILGPEAPVVAVKIIGIMLGLVAVLACHRLALRITGSELAAGIAASLFALEPRLIMASLSGMETCLLVTLVAWAAVALIERRFLLFLVLLGLVPVTRPEGVIALPLAILGGVGLARTWGPWWKALAAKRSCSCSLPHP